MGGTRELRKVFFLEIPVKVISNDINNSYKDILTRIKENRNELKLINELEILINNMIYKEYCLTIQEIKLVEDFNQVWLKS